MASYWNDEKGTYVPAAVHFGYEFEHKTENQLADSWEGVEAWLDENVMDDERDAALDDIELDYENGNYYIRPIEF